MTDVTISHTFAEGTRSLLRVGWRTTTRYIKDKKDSRDGPRTKSIEQVKETGAIAANRTRDGCEKTDSWLSKHLSHTFSVVFGTERARTKQSPRKQKFLSTKFKPAKFKTTKRKHHTTSTHTKLEYSKCTQKEWTMNT